ncbi:MAG: AAA domain-containing protein [Chloroflexota bacterium]
MAYDNSIPVSPNSQGHLKVTPTDISQFIRLEQCQRYLRLRLHERAHGRAFLTDYGVWPQSIPPLLTQSGSEFEERIEAAVSAHFPAHDFAKSAKYAPTRPPDNEKVVELARQLPVGETLVLFQVRLSVALGRWAVRGDVDVLRMARISDGTLHLLVADMKSSASAKVEFWLQVAFYQSMLTQLFVQAELPHAPIRPAILYRGAVLESKDLSSAQLNELACQREAAKELFGVDNALLEFVPDPHAYLEAVEDLVTGQQSLAESVVVAPFEEVPYHLTFKCDGCLYNEFCMKSTAEHDDLSLIPHLTAMDKEALKRGGVTTVKELANLKDLRPSGDGTSGRNRSELVPAPGKEALARKLSSTWPVGPRLDELIHRARYYRRWRKDDIKALFTIPSKGHGSLPFCDASHNPNLVRVYIDAQHDYLQDRLYMVGSLVAACEGGQERPERQRAIVHMCDGVPDSAEKEEALLVRWVEDTIQAVVELAAPDAKGEPSAPVHLIFFNSYEQRVLLDALGRHLQAILGATVMYDFLTQLGAFDSPLITFLDHEIRDLKNYPMMCQSLQSVATFLRFDWQTPHNYRALFKERLFDYAGRLEADATPEGEPPWYTSRARFKSDIPLEYAYAAWGELPPVPREGLVDELAPYRPANTELLTAFEVRRLAAMQHITRDFRGNHLTQKTPFRLPDLATFSDKATSLARALQEFVTIERHVDLAAWKSARNAAPERRVLTGETLIVRYLEEDQESDAVERNRDAQRRSDLRRQYEEAYLSANSEADRVELTKEQKKDVGWSLEGVQFALRLETGDTGISIDEILALTTLKEGDRLVLFPRWTVDSRLPVAEQLDNTPTPKQLLYGPRANIVRIRVERDDVGNAERAFVDVVMQRDSGASVTGFLFSSFHKQPLRDSALYTLDDDPSDIYAYWGNVVAKGLCELEGQGASDLHTLYERIARGPASKAPVEDEALLAQQRFLEGLQALHAAGALHDFEESKCSYIGGLITEPILLVQGPPGTGKSYSTAYAVLSRMQAAMSVDRDFRVLVSCKTHAATDVLAVNIAAVQRRLRRLSESHPQIFTRYFDARLLEVPIVRVAGRQELDGIESLRKDSEKEKGDVRNVDIIAGKRWCVVAATPGGVYGMIKERWSNKSLFGHHFIHCTVLDEASQMNLPEAAMATLPLHPSGQVIVVGDPRQMPPIVKHSWGEERRRTFQEYRSYESLFDTLLELQPPLPIVRFSESFRLHADMAEFLRQEIYSKDGIPYHSRKRGVLRRVSLADPFVAAVLSPQHPLVVVVHDEAQSQKRNIYERDLVVPVLEALADEGLYGLDAAEGFGVVVPHRAQRAELQSVLPLLTVLDPLTGAVVSSAVDTVERFQGGERTAIVVSATESDREYLRAASEFLYDPRRLTVAISRAKQKMVLVVSRSVVTMFSPDEEAFSNAQMWKNLLRRTCTTLLWEGERGGKRVEVWGNTSTLPIADVANPATTNVHPALASMSTNK